MLRRERLAVDLVGEEHLGTARLVERKAPLVRVLDLALDAAVEAGEEHLDGAVLDPGFLEQRRERRARPLRVADRLVDPRLAERARRVARPAVARALERDGDARLRPLLQLFERERDRPRDVPAEVELPARDVHVRDVEVDQEVVQAERRDVVAQHLERKAVVPQRERELDPREVLAGALDLRFDRQRRRRYALRTERARRFGPCPVPGTGRVSPGQAVASS